MKMRPTHVIHAQLEVRECAAEIFVNGLPVVKLGSRATSPVSIAAQQYLVPGSNELEILVDPGPRPALSRVERRGSVSADAMAAARIVRFPDGVIASPENGEVLAEILCRPAGASIFPVSVSRRAELPSAAGPWVWQSAPVLEPGPRLFRAAHEVLLRAAAALREGSARDFRALTDLRVRDALRAYPALDEAYIQRDIEQTVAFFSQSPDPVDPLDPARHGFRVVGGGRVLECIDVDGRDSLRVRHPQSGALVPFRMLLAEVGGELRVVR